MRRVNLLIILSFILFLSGCSTTIPVGDPGRIAAITDTVTPTTVSVIRQAALKETAGEIGAQAALAWKANQLNLMLKQESRMLDRVFNFTAMLASNIS